MLTGFSLSPRSRQQCTGDNNLLLLFILLLTPGITGGLILQISRSLTIKQMAIVSVVAVVFIFVFAVILLFHFVQQQNYHTAMQMEGIARAVRQPLSAAVLSADIPAARSILQQINPSGIVSRADVVLPDQFQALQYSFTEQRTVPGVFSRLFDIPQQISLPLYSMERSANPQPLAYLVLQADSWRSYRYVAGIMSTLITSWLLLSLMLSVAISWCINRLMVHPLRHVAQQLDNREADAEQPLPLPFLHHDDEIGMIVRNYNSHQQRVRRLYQQKLALAAIPKVLLLTEAGQDGYMPLLVLHCDTLNDARLNEAQQQRLLLALTDKLIDMLPAGIIPAQMNHSAFLLLCDTPPAAISLTELSHYLVNGLTETELLQSLPLRPVIRVSAAVSSRNSGMQSTDYPPG